MSGPVQASVGLGREQDNSQGLEFRDQGVGFGSLLTAASGGVGGGHEGAVVRDFVLNPKKH